MSEINKELFWDASIEEVKRGYKEFEDYYKCIICEEEFEKGRIYERNSNFYDSEKAVKMHISEKHNSILEYLLNMNSTFTGVSQSQSEVLKLISYGLSDKEIASRLKVAQSTIRNHRYKLREKEKQARLFLAMMELLSENIKKEVNILDKDILRDAHKSATTIDDRYNITEKERKSTIKNHMDENGALKTFPSKEKKKIIVLSEIMKNFSKDTMYSEKQINRILKRIYEDYVTIRRSLIEYGFLDRTDDGSKYWVKE